MLDIQATTDTLALSTDEACRLMGQMQLITSDIFDYFFMLVFQWYMVEASDEDTTELPNLYYLLNGEHIETKTFLRTFMHGFAKQYCEHHGIVPKPGDAEFTSQHENDFMDFFMAHFHKLQNDMRHDIELVLDSLGLSYVWDDRDAGGEVCDYKNKYMIGVW